MTKLRAFTMPKWGIEMTEGTIAEWMVSDGDSFSKGQLLTLIETNKITNEVEAEYDGVIAKILVPAGNTVNVGTLLAVISDGSADQASIEAFVESFVPAGGAPAPVQTSAAAAPVVATKEIPSDLAISPAARQQAQLANVDVSMISGSGRGGRITLQDVDQASKPPRVDQDRAPVSVVPTTSGVDQFFASPLAKRIAVNHNIELSKVKGTGPRGRICKADVIGLINPKETATARPAVAEATGPDVTIIKMSTTRKAIARQLTLSKSTIPHFYLRHTARIDALLAMREQARRSTGQAPSVNDYLIRACAVALVRHPDINIQVHGDEIHRYKHADVSVAVATDRGLITPIVRSADTKSVGEISFEIKELAGRARQGRLAAEEFQGGSFSLSNLGMFGIEGFDAIINPPQGAILAVGAARQETVASDHALTFATRIHLSLSCDHRAIDGAVGARFLADLAALLESPEELTR
ncbi:MAG TPA: 2-oxo acid dehydrogenase subunit E2 [Sphingomicrobium sp.]|nr:2-oxo acid dehydrogenase subunit E2 [Sphingomicrobium sp.]